MTNPDKIKLVVKLADQPAKLLLYKGAIFHYLYFVLNLGARSVEDIVDELFSAKRSEQASIEIFLKDVNTTHWSSLDAVYQNLVGVIGCPNDYGEYVPLFSVKMIDTDWCANKEKYPVGCFVILQGNESIFQIIEWTDQTKFKYAGVGGVPYYAEASRIVCKMKTIWVQEDD